jgi:hypothetical protein
MIRVSRLSVLYSAVLILLFTSLMPVTGAESPMDLIVQADFLYMTRYVEEDITQAIALFEAVIPDLNTLSMNSQSYVLNRLSQLCYEASTFSDGNTPEDRVLFEKGKNYGLQSLRLNPEFAEAENRDFEEAVSYATDASALLWTADNWGKLGEINPIEGLLNQGKFIALFQRSLEVDSRLWGGSSSNALGSLLIMSPSTLGGDKEAGLDLVYSAIDIDPSYLPNQVVLAEYWGFTYNFLGQMTGIRDAALIESQLNLVLEADIGDWPFWNRHAKENAQVLLDKLVEMRN